MYKTQGVIAIFYHFVVTKFYSLNQQKSLDLIFSITEYIFWDTITFEPIDYATLLCYVVFILWSHQFIFQCLSTLKVYLNAILSANVFETLTKSLVVWNCDRSFVVVIASVGSINVCTVFWSIFLQLHPLYGPWRILACCYRWVLLNPYSS